MIWNKWFKENLIKNLYKCLPNKNNYLFMYIRYTQIYIYIIIGCLNLKKVHGSKLVNKHFPAVFVYAICVVARSF